MKRQIPRQLRGPLIVLEDSDADFEVLARAIERSKRRRTVVRCESVSEASDVMHERGKWEGSTLGRPSLIFADLELSGGGHGLELLSKLKKDPTLRGVPIVVLTGSKSQANVTRAYDLGAASYVLKARDFDEFSRVIDTTLEYWFEVVVLPNRGLY